MLNARLKIVGGRNDGGTTVYSGDLSYLDASQLSSIPHARHNHNIHPLESTSSITKPSQYRKKRSGTGISVTVSQEVHTAIAHGRHGRGGEKGMAGGGGVVHIPMVDIEGEGDEEGSEEAVSRFAV